MEDLKELPFFIGGAGGGKVKQPVQRTPIETPEGIKDQVVGSGIVDRAVSLTQIRVWDLISEGPIGGLVSGEYSYEGSIGEIGYRKATFIPYPEKSLHGVNVRWLRSIYWNESPVLDKSNLFNFQEIDVQYSNGNPNGAIVGSFSNQLTVSRSINERLRGPNATLDSKGTVISVKGEIEAFAKTYRIINRDCKGIQLNIRINQLLENIVKGAKIGDVVPTQVIYRIYYKPLLFNEVNNGEVAAEQQYGFTLAKEEIVYGKISYGYIRSTVVNFDSKYSNIPDFAGWVIKVFRITPESIQNIIRNQTYIDTITEVYGESLCYPNSAIITEKFSADYFSQIPARAFDVELLRVKIPSNYDPRTRSYSGPWDGTWKTDENGYIAKEWTDNPAWCFYDILTSKRYGLGEYLDESLVDKLTLYKIAQYCDTIVSNGEGGLEPRFTCNLYITSREEAYKVLNDMASIFRGIIYFANGGIYTSQDSQKTATQIFTNANVENGDFSYSSTSKKNRHTIAVVRYNDKTDFFRPAVEYVEDVNGIRRYGIREIEMSAFGCTSRSQAIRMGRWALVSEGDETESITFAAGLEGAYLRPGDLFKVLDNNKKAQRYAGRTQNIDLSSAKPVITLDSFITGFAVDQIYLFSLITPTYNYNSSVSGLNSDDTEDIRRSQIQSVPFRGQQASSINGKTVVNFNGSPSQFNFIDYLPQANSIWAIEASGNVSIESSNVDHYSYFRAIKIEEKEDLQYIINGISYSLDKFTQIESGLNFEQINLSLPPPSDVDALQLSLVDATPNLKAIKYVITESDNTNINSFLVYAKNSQAGWTTGDFAEQFGNGEAPYVGDFTPDSRYLINIIPVNVKSGLYIPSESNIYHFRAYGRNRQGMPSLVPASNSINFSTANAFNNFTINSLRISDFAEDNLYINRTGAVTTTISPTFIWQAGFRGLDNPSGLITSSNMGYRITIRKSVDSNAIFPATGYEIKGYPAAQDRYKPSNVIYYELTGYRSTNLGELSYTFESVDNIEAFTDYYNSVGSGIISGIIREYDVVVEAHLIDGTSSAGGNFTTDANELGRKDATYADVNKNGWDIFYLNNPRTAPATLTHPTGLTACLVAAESNPAKFCTDQYVNSEGLIKLSILNGSLGSDIQGGYVYSAKTGFSFPEAMNGVTSNGFAVQNSRFTSLSDPISANSNLFGVKSGFMAVSFFDTFDERFESRVQSEDPEFDLRPYLALSNVVPVLPRGVFEQDKFKFRAWVDVKMIYSVNSNIDTYLTSISWNGAGIESVQYLSVGKNSFNDVTVIRFKITYLPTVSTNETWAVLAYPMNRNHSNSSFDNSASFSYAIDETNQFFSIISVYTALDFNGSTYRGAIGSTTDKLRFALVYNDQDPTQLITYNRYL